MEPPDLTTYRPVIGLEIHVQLRTASKMFCSSPNNPDETEPNRNICEVCTAQPGALPVVNEEALKLGIITGMALNCTIPEYSKFDRKSYFYPDLPKGYQISQYDRPIAEHGYLDIGTKRIRIRRAHLEEDAGKNVHPEGLPFSLVDLNRAGTPLLEIVTEPDIESAAEAKAFLHELRTIVRYIGASTADMEKGTMRCEPNISVRKPGQQELPNYKVEVKNINSFVFAEKAIAYEIVRQTEILAEGGTPKQVTMGWNEKTNATVEQRSKEEANDYRYFPEPDLPILHIDSEMQARLRAEIPELPAAKRARFSGEYSLPPADIQNLIEWKALTEFFEEVMSELLETDGAGASATGANVAKLSKMAANWCLQDFSALLNAQNVNPADSRVTPANFADLVELVDAGKVSVTAAKQVLAAMFETGGEPSHIVEDMGLGQVSDAGVIEAAVAKVISENAKAAADYRAGNEKTFGFLVGMAMKELAGKGNPQVVNEALKAQLGK